MIFWSDPTHDIPWRARTLGRLPTLHQLPLPPTIFKGATVRGFANISISVCPHQRSWTTHTSQIDIPGDCNHPLMNSSTLMHLVRISLTSLAPLAFKFPESANQGLHAFQISKFCSFPPSWKPRPVSMSHIHKKTNGVFNQNRKYSASPSAFHINHPPAHMFPLPTCLLSVSLPVCQAFAHTFQDGMVQSTRHRDAICKENHWMGKLLLSWQPEGWLPHSPTKTCHDGCHDTNYPYPTQAIPRPWVLISSLRDIKEDFYRSNCCCYWNPPCMTKRYEGCQL